MEKQYEPGKALGNALGVVAIEVTSGELYEGLKLQRAKLQAEYGKLPGMVKMQGKSYFDTLHALIDMVMSIPFVRITDVAEVSDGAQKV